MKTSFPTALFLVFLILKLTHVIAWSWWWVTAPLWVSIGLVFLVAFVVELKKELETPAEKASRQLRELAERLERR